jgi:hypothetical protein
MTSRRSWISAVTALLAVLGLMFAASAVAYTTPRPPGSPGGPPTKPKTGSAPTKKAVSTVATKAAALTAAEVAAKGKFSTPFTTAKAGVLTGTIKSGSTLLGSGTKSFKKKGTGTLVIKLSPSGIAFLNAHNGKAIKLTFTLVFTPVQGTVKTSTVTVTTLA